MFKDTLGFDFGPPYTRLTDLLTIPNSQSRLTHADCLPTLASKIPSELRSVGSISNVHLVGKDAAPRAAYLTDKA